MLLPEICCFKSNHKLDKLPEDIVNQAHKEADNIKKRNYLRQKEENQILREQTEAELRERRSELQRQETRLLQKEENLERKSDLLDKKMRF